MEQNTTVAQEADAFRAVLTQHRSLPARGFLVLMGLICGFVLTYGIIFLAMGAWPVLLFLGPAAVLVYLAFLWNYRSALLHEVVELTPGELRLTRIYPSGRREVHTFNPYWARVLLEETRNGRTVLQLHVQGEELVFGRFLTDDERRDFAAALRRALRAANAATGAAAFRPGHP